MLPPDFIRQKVEDGASIHNLGSIEKRIREREELALMEAEMEAMRKKI